MGHFGHLAILGHFGSFWAIWDHFRPFWSFWAILGHFGPVGHFGPFWAILGHFGPFWPFKTVLAILCHFELAHSSAQNGPKWPKGVGWGPRASPSLSACATHPLPKVAPRDGEALGHHPTPFGHFGPVGHFGPFWAILGHFGPF